MEIENRYFDYLCSLVGRSYEYGILLQELHSIEYYALIPNDDNRGSDGRHLRSVFLDEAGPTWAPSLPRYECTVLEMLIGLSFRLEFETAQSRWEKLPSEWFWILIDNLGLSDCTDVGYSECCGNDLKVSEVVGKMLSRNYEANGEGGLFPIKHSKRDQRRVEIWYQMTDYVIENYPI